MKYSFASFFLSYLVIPHLLSNVLRQRIALSVSLPLLLVIGSTSACMAQVFGKGNATSSFSPNFLSPAQGFQLDSGVTCPTTSFSVTGFGGTANDFANANLDRNASSNSGANNYGMAVSLNIPLGGQLAIYCTDFAALRTEDLRKRVQINESRYQSQLVQQCYYLVSIYVDFNNEYYDEDGPGAALFPCRSIAKSINPPDKSSLRQIDPKELPKISDPTPLTPRPILTEPTR